MGRGVTEIELWERGEKAVCKYTNIYFNHGWEEGGRIENYKEIRGGGVKIFRSPPL